MVKLLVQAHHTYFCVFFPVLVIEVVRQKLLDRGEQRGWQK
jgi:hypothetical protein